MFGLERPMARPIFGWASMAVKSSRARLAPAPALLANHAGGREGEAVLLHPPAVSTLDSSAFSGWRRRLGDRRDCDLNKAPPLP